MTKITYNSFIARDKEAILQFNYHYSDYSETWFAIAYNPLTQHDKMAFSSALIGQWRVKEVKK